MARDDDTAIASIVRRGPDMCFFEQAVAVMTGKAMVTKRDAPAQGRYFILLAVLNYVNLLGEAPNLSPLSYLDAGALADCRDGRAVLILDLSNEGPPFYFEMFDALHRRLDELRIERRNVFFVSQNRRLQNDYEEAFGKGHLRFWTLDYFPLVIADLVAADRQNVDLGGYSPLSGMEDKLFSCLNSAPRWHRVLLFRWLQQTKLLDEGLVSFHGVNAENPKGNEIDLATPPEGVRAKFSDLLDDLILALPSQPMRFDDVEAFGNSLAGNLLLTAYARANISLVTESDFFNAKTIRLTEKTMKALVLGHPFIIVGAANTVALVRSLGFKTFDAIIDHSYDLVEDDVERLARCFDSIHAALNRIKNDARAWRESASSDALFNCRHARETLLARLRSLEFDPILGDLDLVRGEADFDARDKAVIGEQS